MSKRATGIAAGAVLTLVVASRLMSGGADVPSTTSDNAPRSTATATQQTTRDRAPTATSAVSRPPASRVAPTKTPTRPTELAADCDPSYPGVCIRPRSQFGDLDCPDVGLKRFAVRPPDPHDFDADFDGIGCER